MSHCESTESNFVDKSALQSCHGHGTHNDCVAVSMVIAATANIYHKTCSQGNHKELRQNALLVLTF